MNSVVKKEALAEVKTYTEFEVRWTASDRDNRIIDEYLHLIMSIIQTGDSSAKTSVTRVRLNYSPLKWIEDLLCGDLSEFMHSHGGNFAVSKEEEGFLKFIAGKFPALQEIHFLDESDPQSICFVFSSLDYETRIRIETECTEYFRRVAQKEPLFLLLTPKNIDYNSFAPSRSLKKWGT